MRLANFENRFIRHEKDKLRLPIGIQDITWYYVILLRTHSTHLTQLFLHSFFLHTSFPQYV